MMVSQERSHQAKKAGLFEIVKAYIVLPLPLVKANRKQTNRSALQANRSVFRLTGVLFSLNYKRVLTVGHLF